jgi:hypothetical protein
MEQKLIDYLKATNDRVSAIAKCHNPAWLLIKIGPCRDNTFANQEGLPNGWDMNGGSTDISLSPGYPGGTGAGADLHPLVNTPVRGHRFMVV